MRRSFRVIAALQPSILFGLLVLPFVLYSWLQNHNGWLSVWTP